MPYVENESVRIWYETFGDRSARETILLLSGAGTDHTVWQAQIKALEGQFSVIAIDNRGSGRSDRPEGPYSAEEMAEDVRAVLVKEGVIRLNLVGFSLGGLVAQKFVSRYPEMITRLVLMNCSLGSGNPDTVLPRKDVINMFLFFAALTQEDCCRNSVDYCFGPALEHEDPARYESFLAYTMANYLGIPFQIPILVSEEQFLDEAAARPIPVLIILSNDDPVTPPENGEAFKKHLPHATIEYLDGHHASMLIHPDETNRLLLAFLSKGREES